MRWPDIIDLKRDFPVNGSDRYGNGMTKYIAPEIARVAWEEYNMEHPGQDFERIKARGGFGWQELVTLLYKRIVREKKMEDKIIMILRRNGKMLMQELSTELNISYKSLRYRVLKMTNNGIVESIPNLANMRDGPFYRLKQEF